MCECRGYLFFISAPGRHPTNYPNHTKSNKRRMSFSKHSLDSAVNWINIFPDWLCLMAARSTPWTISVSLTVFLFLLIITAVYRPPYWWWWWCCWWRRSTAHHPRRPVVWSHMSGGESVSWGMAESQGNIKDFFKNNCVFLAALH